MSTERFLLPDVGEGLTEADILQWHVAPGDTVAVNQVIVEIETAKAAVELPAPFAGVVGALLADAEGRPRPAAGRDDATTALSTVLALQGVWGVRVHAVQATRDAVAVVERLNRRSST